MQMSANRARIADLEAQILRNAAALSCPVANPCKQWTAFNYCLLETAHCSRQLEMPMSVALSALSTSRLIYASGEQEVEIAMRNQGNQQVVVQTYIADQQGGSDTTSFVMIPPLARIEGGTQQAIRILQVGDLPTDRESVFQFNAKVSHPTDSGAAATTLTIPLFYRPAGLV
ncbi:fimbria/pilus periplasmic chaperone [Streptomyces sp. NPDC054874]